MATRLAHRPYFSQTVIRWSSRSRASCRNWLRRCSTTHNMPRFLRASQGHCGSRRSLPTRVTTGRASRYGIRRSSQWYSGTTCGCFSFRSSDLRTVALLAFGPAKRSRRRRSQRSGAEVKSRTSYSYSLSVRSRRESGYWGRCKPQGRRSKVPRETHHFGSFDCSA